VLDLVSSLSMVLLHFELGNRVGRPYDIVVLFSLQFPIVRMVVGWLLIWFFHQ